jgi:hypothetical protein
MAQHAPGIDQRRRSWIVGLSILSALGVALSVLESGYRLGFDEAIGLFGVLSFVPLIPLIGLRMKSSVVRTNVLLAAAIAFFVWVWGLLAIAVVLEPLAVVGLWHTLTLFGMPLSVLLLILLALERSKAANG